MSCNCSPTKPIPCCLTSLIIGTISNLSSSLNIYFRNITTGNTLNLPGSSDGAGLVTVDVSDQQFASNQSYEVWVTLASGNMNARLDVTIGVAQYDCVEADFFKVKDEEGTIDIQSSFQIEMV